MEVIYQPIGMIHSPFKSLADMPIQPTSEVSGSGIVEILPEFVDGLKDLAGFSHIYLLCHLHKIHRSNLMVTPFLDSVPTASHFVIRVEAVSGDQTVTIPYRGVGYHLMYQERRLRKGQSNLSK